MKILLYFFILLNPLLIQAASTAEPSTMVAAQVISVDGTTVTLDDVRINNSTDLVLYTKPTKVKSTSATEIVLENNPSESKVGFSLRTVKKIMVKHEAVPYVYQKDAIGAKQQFIELQVDGTACLAPKGWVLQGFDNSTNKKRMMNLHIVQEITITGTRQRSESPAEICAPCVCPTPS